MKRQPMGPVLGPWFKGMDETPPDAHECARELMAHLPETRQRGRWWPLPALDHPAPIPATNGRQPAGGFTMFSALKFVAAGVIVALFGGFLLAGILTTQQGDEMVPAAVTESPSPMTTEGLLAGMVTEEVEPGVFRVVNDGYRDLGHPAPPVFRHDVVIPDGAGGVWRVMPEGRFYRIGEEPEWTFDPGLVAIDQSNTEATPDGRLVTVGVIGVKFFRDGSWGDGEYGFYDGLLGDVGIGDDGMVWLLDPEDATLYWYGPGQEWSFSSWKDTYEGEVRGDEMVVVGGDVWLAADRGEYGGITDAFLRFDGANWQVVDAPDGLVRYTFKGDGSTFGVAPSGVLWTAGDAGSPLHRSLARYDGAGWTIFGEADGVRPWSGNQRLWVPWDFRVDMLRVAPDGSAWVNAAVPVPDTAEEVVCDGLGRYDGEEWSSYLSGRCVWDYDFATDGSLWVVAKDGVGPPTEDEQAGLAVHTYVITPEAVAATE